jgi:hypothetical protein
MLLLTAWHREATAGLVLRRIERTLSLLPVSPGANVGRPTRLMCATAPGSNEPKKETVMDDDRFEIATDFDECEHGELPDLPTEGMLGEYAYSLMLLHASKDQMDRATMAQVIRELEKASALCSGESVEEYRAEDLAVAQQEVGIELTMEDFVAVYIDGTADIVDGVVVPYCGGRIDLDAPLVAVEPPNWRP